MERGDKIKREGKKWCMEVREEGEVDGERRESRNGGKNAVSR